MRKQICHPPDSDSLLKIKLPKLDPDKGTRLTMAFNPCCCMTLKTGAFIIGILEIVFSAISLVGTSIALGGIAFINSFDNGTLMKNLSEEIQKEHPELSGGNVETTSKLHTTYIDGLNTKILNRTFISYTKHSVIFDHVTRPGLGLVCHPNHHGIYANSWDQNGKIVPPQSLDDLRRLCLALSFILNISVACVKSNDNLLLDLPSSFLSALLEIYFIYVVYRLHVEIRDGSSHRPKPKYEFS
ncbi:hypothetical protein Ocin01_09198 [Orchesella cincta]|uniref:Uncharacterized protein n=1 Tax=Orchesella cincta TaxID=48709 RepID=A0A1D2MWZ3_ORCCI|nr:hypothetical protein Ocin01_09198 [Orchesella cincta]